MKVIVVSAHPDDMELACSGHLLKLQSQGANVISVVTVRPSAEANPARSQQIVEQELDRSYHLSGFELRVFDTLLHSNGRPNLCVDNNTMTDLAQLLESCDLAIIPNPHDYHQDHRATHALALPLLLSRAREIWCMSSVPYCYHQTDDANVTSDISDHWSAKKQLLECYSSYLTDSMIKKVQRSNQHWAGKINTDYAEQFQCIHRAV
jgi:LmbE family N-acetylglucosaminyl deacetylase